MRTVGAIRSLSERVPRPGINGPAVLAFVRTGTWPLPAASVLALLVAMVGGDEDAEISSDGRCKFSARLEDTARDLALPQAAVEQTLWCLINRAKALGVTITERGSWATFELGASYTSVHPVAGRVDWNLVLTHLRGVPRTGHSLAVLRMMLDAYPDGTRIEAVLDPHGPSATTTELADALACDARDIRGAFTSLKASGLWDSPRHCGRNRNTWRWHPQLFGFAPFAGDVPLVPQEVLWRAEEEAREVSRDSVLPVANSPLVADIEAIAALYQKGMLTFDEFVRLKAKLLA